MLHTQTDFAPAPATSLDPDGLVADYDRVRKALAFMTGTWREQPSTEAIAAHVGLSPSHLHHVFRRWAGITPKTIAQTLAHSYVAPVLTAHPT